MFGSKCDFSKGIFVNVMRGFSSINKGCWFCGVFKTLFEAMNQISSTIATNLKDDFTKILILLLAFYILFKVAKMHFSFAEQPMM